VPAGEWLQQLRPRELPAVDAKIDAVDALEWPAVQLLIERIEAEADALDLHDVEAVLAIDICRGLDGVPLAIELAAAASRNSGCAALPSILAIDSTCCCAAGARRRAQPLPRHWCNTGRAGEAMALLGPAVGRFDAALMTRDLSPARQVLAMAVGICRFPRLARSLAPPAGGPR
jgi:hypothetical protein